MKILPNALLASTLLLGSIYVQAATQAGMDGMNMDAAQKTAPMSAKRMADMVDGEVNKVDKTAKKITLTHGTIKHLAMQGMTMAYPVKDGVSLDKVKAGDKIRFLVERSGNAIVVTAIEQAK